MIAVLEPAAEVFDSLGSVTLVASDHLTLVTASSSVATETTSGYLLRMDATI